MVSIARFDSADTAQVVELYRRVFGASEGEAEGRVIADLVCRLVATTEPEDLLGFVAVDNDELVGCIFFSRFLVPNGSRTFLLSPVAVATDVQGTGVGQQLIGYGLDYLKTQKVDLVFTYGDPKYYSKTGFNPIDEAIVKAPYPLSQPEGWLAQSLAGRAVETMSGETQCVAAFADAKYW